MFNKIKKYCIFLFCFCIIFAEVILLSGDLMAQTKSVKRVVRKAGTAPIKSSGGAKKVASSGAGTTNKRVVRKASSSGAKRTLANKRVASGKSVRSATTNRARVARKTIGNKLSFMNQLEDNTSAQEQACVNDYVSCMDDQIKPILSKYIFINEDEAVNVAVDTGLPFRCMFFDVNSVTLDQRKKDANMCFGVSSEKCDNRQRGFSELYSAYNYYCAISRNLKNNIGRKINQCNLATGEQFASKYSSAYYSEVLRRMADDGLQMVNLESSTIYKNFISQLELQNESSYIIDKSIVSEIYGSLNLEEETELFSVNVVPPVGSNSYLAGSQFSTASNKCFASEAGSIVGKTAKEKEVIKAANARIVSFQNNNCVSIKPQLERYYLVGKWSGNSVDEAGAVSNDVSDIESEFFSAKASCNLYEQALISNRDVKYGEFDNQMQNWIEDNIAKMIRKKIKSTASLAQAETELKNMDGQISNERFKTKSEIQFERERAENDIRSAERDQDVLTAESGIARLDAEDAISTQLAGVFATKLKMECNDMAQAKYADLSLCKNQLDVCFSSVGPQSSYYKWIADVKVLSIKINRDGNTVNSTATDFAKYMPINIDSNGRPKPDTVAGYYKVNCSAVKGFDHKLSAFSSLLGQLSTKWPDGVASEAVKKDLEAEFPVKD